MTKILKKWLLLISGFASLIIGLIALIIPLVPTTPFLLISAACFFHSSDRFYNMLLNHPWAGRHIKNYREDKSVTSTMKWQTIAILWISITTSALVFVHNWWIRALMWTIATCVTIHILSLKTAKS